MDTHARRGGTIAKPIPRSMSIVGTVAAWERWTGMRFPGGGRYAPVEIDHGRGCGCCREPNVWIMHTLIP